MDKSYAIGELAYLLFENIQEDMDGMVSDLGRLVTKVDPKDSSGGKLTLTLRDGSKFKVTVEKIG